MAELNTGSRITADIGGVRADLEAVLRKIGDESLTRWLASTGQSTGDRAKVVFAGEIHAGKTSLINALLERPGLLPVGTGGPTTSTHVAVGRGTPERLDVEPDDRNTELLIDEPRLSGLTLFDTPGIGNPNSAYGRVILDVLSEVTALVFLCPAGNKISTSERDFLFQAAQRVDRIIFVLSKIDDLPQWRDSLRENEETVRGDHRRFPNGRFADISFIPVSARKSLVPALRERSGIEDLWAELLQITNNHAHLSALNQLRVLRSATSDAHTVLGRRLQALNDAALTESTNFDERLKELSDKDKAWRLALNSEIQIAKSAVHLLTHQRIMELRNAYQTKMTDVTPEVLAQVETGLVADLSAMQVRAATDVREHTAEVAMRLMRDVPGAEAVVDVILARLPDPENSLSPYLGERPPVPTSPSEKLAVLQATFMGWGVSSGAATAVLTVLFPPAAFAAPLIGIPGAVAWRYWTKQVRERTADALHTQTWVRDTIAQAGNIIDNEITSSFSRATHQLQTAIEKAFQDARRQLDDIRQMHAAGRKTVEAEKKRIKDLQRDLVEVGRACDAQRSALTAGELATDTPDS